MLFYITPISFIAVLRLVVLIYKIDMRSNKILYSVSVALLKELVTDFFFLPLICPMKCTHKRESLTSVFDNARRKYIIVYLYSCRANERTLAELDISLFSTLILSSIKITLTIWATIAIYRKLFPLLASDCCWD